MEKKLGLVLSGGGAKGAYQAGMLRALAEKGLTDTITEVAGTSIGTTAAIVPLTIAAIPYTARMVETSIREIPFGLIEAAESMGASPLQIIWKVLIPEALPSIIESLTVVIVSLIGASAMAGTIGGGGLGDLAIRYGYQRFQTDVMIATVIVLIILVQGVQALGNAVSKKLNKTKIS